MMSQTNGNSMYAQVVTGGPLEAVRESDDMVSTSGLNQDTAAVLEETGSGTTLNKHNNNPHDIHSFGVGLTDTACSSADAILNMPNNNGDEEFEDSSLGNEDGITNGEELLMPKDIGDGLSKPYEETGAREAHLAEPAALPTQSSAAAAIGVNEIPDIEPPQVSGSETTNDFLDKSASATASFANQQEQSVLSGGKDVSNRNAIDPGYETESNGPYSANAPSSSTVPQQISSGNVTASPAAASPNGSAATENTTNTNPFHIPVPARLGKIEVKLFVGRLPRVIEESQLTPLFSPFGEVVETVIIRDKASRMHKGSAFVKMASLTEADAAVRALHNLKVIDPQLGPIQVKYANGEPERLGLTMDAAQAGHDLGKLFVGSLPRTISEAEVRQIFECFGRIDEVVLMKDSNTGQPKGCAFVKFTFKEMAIHAIKALHGQVTLPGCPRALEVKFAENRRATALPTTTATPQMTAAPPLFMHGPKTSASGPPMPNNTGMRMTGATQQSSPPSNLNPRTAGGWSEYFTADGKPYYHHTMTKTTQWTKPLEFERATAPYGQAGTAPTLSMYNPIGSSGMGNTSASATTNSESDVSGPPGANVFVFHIPNEWGQNEVIQHFSQFGRVLSCYVATDRITGRNKGYGFISYDDVQSAANAVLGMNGFPVNSKRLKVSIKSGEESYAAHLLGGHMHGHQPASGPPSMMVPSASAQHAGTGANYAPVGMYHTAMSSGAPPSAGSAALLSGAPTAAGLGSYRSTPY